jgi:uncharacterized protein YegP (UPF0339 family)
MKTRLRFQFGPSKKNRQFYWHIKARGNGKVIAQGEGYPAKVNAKKVYSILGYSENEDVCSLEELDRDGNLVPEPEYGGTIVSSRPKK